MSIVTLQVSQPLFFYALEQSWKSEVHVHHVPFSYSASFQNTREKVVQRACFVSGYCTYIKLCVPGQELHSIIVLSLKYFANQCHELSTNHRLNRLENKQLVVSFIAENSSFSSVIFRIFFSCICALILTQYTTESRLPRVAGYMRGALPLWSRRKEQTHRSSLTVCPSSFDAPRLSFKS